MHVSLQLFRVRRSRKQHVGRYICGRSKHLAATGNQTGCNVHILNDGMQALEFADAARGRVILRGPTMKSQSPSTVMLQKWPNLAMPIGSPCYSQLCDIVSMSSFCNGFFGVTLRWCHASNDGTQALEFADEARGRVILRGPKMKFQLLSVVMLQE